MREELKKTTFINIPTLHVGYLNNSETIAYNWLLKHYSDPNTIIKFTSNHSPDFVVDNKIGYEVKRGHKDKLGNIHITGSLQQVKEIKHQHKLKELYFLVVVDSQLIKTAGKELLEGKPSNRIIPHWIDTSERIDLIIPDRLEHKFKMEAGRRFGAQRDAFTKAVVQALRLWIRDGKGKKRRRKRKPSWCER